jgi:capsular polysaccharide biosynthesis protein
LRRYLNILSSQVLKQETGTPAERLRIFLTRPDVRRSYNQVELLKIAVRYGFEPYSPESASLADQAQTFADADMVVGASGAAWVGMVFRQEKAKFLSWLPSNFNEFCGYSSLAAIN